MRSGMPQWQKHSTPAASRSSPAPCGTQESSGSAVGGGTGWLDTQGGGGSVGGGGGGGSAVLQDVCTDPDNSSML